MRPREAVRDRRQPLTAVDRPSPRGARDVAARRDRVVRFGVGERTRCGRRSSRSARTGGRSRRPRAPRSLPRRFAPRPGRVVLDVGAWNEPGAERRDRLVVAAHVRVVRVEERPRHEPSSRPQLQLHVLAVGAREVPLERDAVGHRRHERFRAAQGPARHDQLDEGGVGVAARVGRVVIGAVVCRPSS